MFIFQNIQILHCSLLAQGSPKELSLKDAMNAKNCWFDIYLVRFLIIVKNFPVCCLDSLKYDTTGYLIHINTMLLVLSTTTSLKPAIMFALTPWKGQLAHSIYAGSHKPTHISIEDFLKFASIPLIWKIEMLNCYLLVLRSPGELI